MIVIKINSKSPLHKCLSPCVPADVIWLTLLRVVNEVTPPNDSVAHLISSSSSEGKPCIKWEFVSKLDSLARCSVIVEFWFVWREKTKTNSLPSLNAILRKHRAKSGPKRHVHYLLLWLHRTVWVSFACIFIYFLSAYNLLDQTYLAINLIILFLTLHTQLSPYSLSRALLKRNVYYG